MAQAPAAPSLRDRAIYGHVSHLGWVVKDVAATTAAWRALGITDIRDTGLQDVPGIAYRGRMVTARMKTAVARFTNGEVRWMQPVGGGTAYADFLASRGEGVQHVGYAVPSLARLEEEVGHFTALGAGVLQSGTRGGARFVELDTAAEGGGMTLALEYDPARISGRAAGPSGNEDPFKTITQYAFVVRDVHAVGRYWERLGLGALRVEKNVSLDRRYRGQPGVFEMLLGWGRGGDVPFEWIQETIGPSVYREHLAKYGEAFHHLGFHTTDLDAALARLRTRGLDVTMSGGWNVNGHEGRFAYLDADKHGGVVIELLWNKPRT